MRSTPILDAMIGKTYRRLTVLRKDGRVVRKDGSVTSHWKILCVCSCGKITSKVASKVRVGETKSCGCLAREETSARLKRSPIATKHGLWNHPLRVQWVGMMNRCNNSDAHNYKHYGGKGIKVCDEWSTLEGYTKSVSKRPSPKHTLHRIDPSKGYCPENCEWITHSEHMKLHWNKGKRI